jgi:hypothetical protein
MFFLYSFFLPIRYGRTASALPAHTAALVAFTCLRNPFMFRTAPGRRQSLQYEGKIQSILVTFFSVNTIVEKSKLAQLQNLMHGGVAWYGDWWSRRIPDIRRRNDLPPPLQMIE